MMRSARRLLLFRDALKPWITSSSISSVHNFVSPNATKISRLELRRITTGSASYSLNQDAKVDEIEKKVEEGQHQAPQSVRSPNSSVISDVMLDHSSRMLKVCWKEGESDIFPYIWLRDNCLCPACFHPPSRSRIHLIQDLNLNICPDTAQVVQDGQEVKVLWSDSHESNYSATWLHARAFNEQRRQERASTYRFTRKYWGAELLEDLPEASFEKLLTDDTALLTWLKQLEVFGFVKVNDAPVAKGQVRKLAEKIGFIRKTHYGEDFTVIAKPDPSNIAYLGGPLQLHADLPYYEYKPGVQFIHCIVQYSGIGGESLVSDGAHVARELQRQYPHKYHILTQTPVDWYDIGSDELGEYNKALRLPMICTNDEGEIKRINMSQPQRNSYFSICAENVAAWYDAMTTFYSLLADPKYCLQFKMTPGTILTFDNQRIVHGRTGYTSGPGSRHIEGCYIDWDEVRSRRRVLETKFGVNSQ